jgi:ABC-type uncharacterized transport system auxiliary subunit
MRPSHEKGVSSVTGFSSGKEQKFFYPVLVLFCLSLTGCGKLPLIHYYDIHYPQAAALHSAPKLKETLGIAGFTASFSYRQSRLLYREETPATKVGFYEDRRWVSSPTELVTLAAISHFRQSGLFARVIPNPGDSSVDYVLKGRITELEELDKPDGYYAKVSLEAELYDLRQKRQTVIWTGAVHRQRKTSVRNVDDIANELSLAVGEALQELVSQLDTVLPAAKS